MVWPGGPGSGIEVRGAGAQGVVLGSQSRDLGKGGEKQP
jgi:hypothetical protein